MNPDAVTIYVASQRSAKVEGTRDAARAIARLDTGFAAARVIALPAPDVAPRMPMTEAETMAGARQRALAVCAQFPTAGTSLSPADLPSGRVYYVGVEGGLDAVSDGSGTQMYVAKTWACVTDGSRLGYGGGPSLLVPSDVAAKVVAGQELGDVVDALAGADVRGTRGAWGVLTLDLIDRREAFRLAVLAAFAPFYNADAYAPANG